MRAKTNRTKKLKENFGVKQNTQNSCTCAHAKMVWNFTYEKIE